MLKIKEIENNKKEFIDFIKKNLPLKFKSTDWKIKTIKLKNPLEIKFKKLKK